MSLQVWLPLNGNLNNQGLSNIIFTNNSGATVDNGGKIGQCYYFNASTYLNESSYDWTNFNVSTFSLCCWYKEPSPVASGNSQMICIGTNSGWNNIRIGLLRRTSNGYPMFSVSDGSTAVQYSFTADSFPLDTWTHIACTYNNGIMKMYLNGELHKTYTTTIVPVLNSSQHLGVGAASNGAEKLTGYLNDVRIYDHCLSPKEVEEISKGLVLHYKLNEAINKNILTSDTTRTITVPTGGTNVYSGYWYLDTAVSPYIKAGTVLTVEYDYNADMTTITEPTSYVYSQFNTSIISPANNLTFEQMTANPIGRKVDTFIVTAAQGSYTSSFRLRVRLNSSNEGGKVTISNIRMYLGTPEENNKIYDSSGYNNNGEIINNLQIISDSPRYSAATNLITTSSHIHTSNLNVTGFSNSYTFTWWGNCSTYSGKMMWGFSDGVRLNGIYNGNLWNTGDGSNNPLYTPGTTTQVSAPSVNVWHHFAMVGNGTQCLVYLDGILWGQAKTYKTISGTSIYFNGWLNNTDYTLANTKLSDFRMYSTALSAAQIKELYDTSTSVDSLGNIYSREVIEI